jgi:leucyl-tRNA synthetase
VRRNRSSNSSALPPWGWPRWDDALIVEDVEELPVQVNGRLRDVVPVPAGATQDEIERPVMGRPKVQANVAGRDVVRVVHVGGRLVNIAVR